MRDELSRKTKSFKIEMRLAKVIGRLDFARLKISHLIFDVVQNL